MKTRIIALLAAGCWLATFPAWADNPPDSHWCSTLSVGRRAAQILGRSGSFALPNQQPPLWTASNDADDPANRNWASLDLDRYPEAGGNLPTTGVQQIQSKSADGEAPRNSDVGASFILIGLGGAVLFSLRWRMSHSSQTDSIQAR